jgi:DNA-binding FadR family transcriptional regulator
MLLTLHQGRSHAAPVSGHDQIAAVLGSEILSGARPPGSRMPSAAELFERFGVSRVLMREVIKTLAAKGMVASKSRVGTLVLEPSHWNWLDPDVLRWRVNLGLDAGFLEHLAQIRRAVEPAAAALAAQWHSAHDIKKLRQALEEMAGAGSDRRLFAEADLQFHLLVSAASGNPLFRSFAGVIETALSASFALSSPTDEQGSAEIVERHASIVTAIEARDASGAAHAMLQVIDEGLARVF